MFSNQRRKAQLLFSLADILLIALAFVAAYWTRASLHLLPHEFYFRTGDVALVLGFSTLAWLAWGYWFNIYGELETKLPRAIASDSLRQAFYTALSLILLEYLLRLDISRGFLILFAALNWLLILTLRMMAGRLAGALRKEFGRLRYVVVAGSGERAIALARRLEQSASNGIRLCGFLSLKPEETPVGITLQQSYPVFPRQQLRSMLRQQVIDEIFFAVEPHELAATGDVLLLCDEEGVRTRIAVDFFPHVNSEMYLERFGPTPLLTFTAAPEDELQLLVKRAVDLALALAAIVAASPLMLLTALAVKLTSPGPIIFRQDRCGLNGRRFTFYKFRSMVADAELRKAEVLHMSERTTATKIPNDPRLTCIGSFLRRYSIDELPQLYNVIKGDMSLVGPRPAVPSEVAQYQQWQRRRMRMRPGLTCIWAINGRDAVDFETWMKMDMQYIDSWSLGLDWSIILKTIPAVVLGRGAN